MCNVILIISETLFFFFQLFTFFIASFHCLYNTEQAYSLILLIVSLLSFLFSYFSFLLIIFFSKFLKDEETRLRPVAASHIFQGGHKTTFTCLKFIYIYIYIYLKFKKKLYTKFYFDHPNNNIEHFDLRITRTCVQ